MALLSGLLPPVSADALASAAASKAEAGIQIRNCIIVRPNTPAGGELLVVCLMTPEACIKKNYSLEEILQCRHAR